MGELRIGVIGYSTTNFDISKAEDLLSAKLENVSETTKDIVLVSGLTNVGIPKIAYEIAESNDWKTVGVACSKASRFDCYPVDEEHIVGEEWGDETEKFLSEIDVLIRVGGGTQSMSEVQEAADKNIPIYESDL